MKTIRYSCGCLSQKKQNSRSINHIYCGTENCKFDPKGKHKKHRAGNAHVKVNGPTNPKG